ncbi:MAG: FGGY family carbohydrate kinase [Bacteroidota bacterium]
MSKDVVLIFDIGKTNKKILLFDRSLSILHEEEAIFEEITDDDGFACDDIERLEQWMLEGCRRFLEDENYDVRGINFATYGATLMYLNEQGKRLTPVYNYLKPMPEGVTESLYKHHGGEAEFCRNTASPALGMLNSGFQALWLKEKKPEIFNKTKTVLHFPQYLSHMLTGKASSEHTSIGCHTALWDFDRMTYHPWTSELGDTLPDPVTVETTFPSNVFDREVPVGIGIHDSSSSLVPYFMNSDEAFILVSTGTWCISMNPFNAEPLTAEQLKQDCLAYMSIQQKPVKSSRLFMGHIHDLNVKRLNKLFGADDSAYKKVALDEEIINSLNQKSGGKRVFFKGGVPEDHLDNSIVKETFDNFEEAYHQLMIDLADLTTESIGLIIGEEDRTKNMYISGGFAKNPIFLKLMAGSFPGKKVYTSEVANATSMGAALVLWKGIDAGFNAAIDLGLKTT